MISMLWTRLLVRRGIQCLPMVDNIVNLYLYSILYSRVHLAGHWSQDMTTGKLSRYIKVNLAFYPCGVDKSSIGLSGWG